MVGLLGPRWVRGVSGGGEFHRRPEGIFRRQRFQGLYTKFGRRQWHQLSSLRISIYPYKRGGLYMDHMF